MTILTLLHLTDAQSRAATTRGDLVVTAGAGSGKTRTLVGRTLWLLEEGVPLDSIVAVTFTDKAAREMRTRVRQAVMDWLAQSPPRQPFWQEILAGLDGARIGTIHSLCARLLREHPAEAARHGIEPGSSVLDEGRAGVLRARAVEEALAWAANDDDASRLFALGEYWLRRVLTSLLERRLDAGAAFAATGDDPLGTWSAALRDWLDEGLGDPRWRACLDTLAGLRADDPADKLEVARQEVLAHAAAVDAARERGDLHIDDAALAGLAALRAATALTGRKANWPGDALGEARDAMRTLRACFDERLKPLADPARPASCSLDEAAAGLVRALHAAYGHALDTYTRALREEEALDFDDLEAGAVALLEEPDVHLPPLAVLVDEFQDTNERQRRIVCALAGLHAPDREPPASLFVVGDAKQSIYRFRGADVTVLSRVEQDVVRSGGEVAALDLTFRAHRSLVAGVNRLLAPVLDELVGPGRPYAIPYAPLEAHRPDPQPGIEPPFVEFLLGLGEPADVGREAAADGLASRLLELHGEGLAWQDVALLFRASTAFSFYEDALERAGIPFVTVAGRGFYDRAEVRVLLNALVAVADPGDDLAMVGLLRSPLVGLTDAALYLLRFPPAGLFPRGESEPCALWPVLDHPALPDVVPPDDLPRALRGRDLIAELHPQAGRVPVAALLEQLLARPHYRAALQAAEGGARARRNVDKLLADAHASGAVSVREFLEYLQALRDTGARESEAPAEAGNAVQLMTVHKAKGLEFQVVVIADAARAGPGRAARVLLDERLGVTLDLRDDDARCPAAHRLAALRDGERDEAEERRLLYVAATRARDLLLVSGHTRLLKGGALHLAGWLGFLGREVGLDDVVVADLPAGVQPLSLAQGVGGTLYPPLGERPMSPTETLHASRTTQHASRDLMAPLTVPPVGEYRSPTPGRVWRVVPQTERPHSPAWAVGTLVHAALHHWCFEDERLASFLRPLAIEMGIVDEGQIHAATLEAGRMLRRFQAHSLWAELDAAQRWHEVVFGVAGDGGGEHGVIDLLARAGEAYKIVEFKTDHLASSADLPVHVRKEGYDQQVRRYVRAARQQLAAEVTAVLVFLNVGGEVEVVEVT